MEIIHEYIMLFRCLSKIAKKKAAFLPLTWDELDVRVTDGVYGLNIFVVFLIRSRKTSDNNGIRNFLLLDFELAFQHVRFINSRLTLYSHCSWESTIKHEQSKNQSTNERRLNPSTEMWPFISWSVTSLTTDTLPSFILLLCSVVWCVHIIWYSET
jgi:hypothetical protein